MTFNGKKFIPVEGDENKGFYRDMQSNAIVYKDQDEYAKYMQSYNCLLYTSPSPRDRG